MQEIEILTYYFRENFEKSTYSSLRNGETLIKISCLLFIYYLFMNTASPISTDQWMILKLPEHNQQELIMFLLYVTLSSNVIRYKKFCPVFTKYRILPAIILDMKWLVQVRRRGNVIHRQSATHVHKTFVTNAHHFNRFISLPRVHCFRDIIRKEKMQNSKLFYS